ncbi:MAG: DUF4290 domain-containing protein [Flavobacteriales bacterium]|tara:strand:- start:129 stop:731 length:603 start_codon:yes stop_codon:yes gene_type:complete
MDYNTSREKLIIPEYGRHIQKMVDIAIEIEDHDERNVAAKSIIKVMGQLNPSLRDVDDFNHKLWDHLQIISNFALDVDSEYPQPTPESVKIAPDIVPYNEDFVKNKHYGKIIGQYIAQAIKIVAVEEKEALVYYIANMMKKAYVTYNKDSVTDIEIFTDLKRLSGGKLDIDANTELVKAEQVSTPRPKRKNNNQKKKKRR